MLTEKQLNDFRRYCLGVVKKLNCKTKELPVNEMVIIRPTLYGWRNARQFDVIDKKFIMYLEDNHQGSVYGTGGVVGGIYYLFTGYTLLTIANVIDSELLVQIKIDSIFDNIDLSELLNCHLYDNEINTYIDSAFKVLFDTLTGGSKLFEQFNMVDEKTLNKNQKVVYHIISSKLIPLFCWQDNYFKSQEVVEEMSLKFRDIEQSTISIEKMGHLIRNIVTDKSFFPFLQDEDAMFSKHSQLFQDFINVDTRHFTVN